MTPQPTESTRSMADIVKSKNPVKTAENPVNETAAVAEEVDPNTAWLSEAELYALELFKKNQAAGKLEGKPIALDIQEKMFEVYLQGKTLGDIRKINAAKFSMGQIVAAAVEGRWDLQRKAYLEDLLTRVRTRALQAAAEGAEFVADAMAVAHKKHGDSLRRFLQSGDPKDLGDFDLGGIGNYRTLVELMLKLTGQDQVRKVSVSGSVEHRGSLLSVPTRPLPEIPSDKAKAQLAEWAEIEKARKERERRG